MIHTGPFKRMEIYHNTAGKTIAEIKAETGCDTIINGVLFNGDGSLCIDQKINGVWLSDEPGDYNGIAWSGSNVPVALNSRQAEYYKNFISSCEVVPGSIVMRSALAFDGENYTIYCDWAKWQDAYDKVGRPGVPRIVVDGGGSSCCICPDGHVDATEKRQRQNRTYICIWERKPIYRVQFGAFGVRQNALNYQNTLKAQGLNTIIKMDLL